MDFRIDRVGELTGDEGIGDFFGQFVGFVDSAFHAGLARCEDDFSAISGNEVAAFDRHGFRHGEDGAVAFGSSYGSQADTRIATGRFDDDRAFFEDAFLFSVFDHGFGDAVFGGAGRVESVEFDQKVSSYASGVVVTFRFQ